MKDCCEPNEKPGILKRLLNGITVLILIALVLFGTLLVMLG